MWYPAGAYTLRQAREFLTKDFVKVIRRTRNLYVERKPIKRHGAGYFEPVLLAMCWCDFLGALYSGHGKPKHAGGLSNDKRIGKFVVDVLGSVNPRYKSVSGDLVRIYRHGTVHAYAPAGAFYIDLDAPGDHLKKRRGRVSISVGDLLRELAEATMYFSRTLTADVTSLKPGTLGAFNKARAELQ